MRLLSALLSAAACAPKAPPVELPLAPPPVAGLVEVGGMAAKASFKQTILRVLATAPAAPCYEALLARDPRAYGEVVVRFTVLADGSVPESNVLFATLSDAPAEACVAGVVKALAFPGVTSEPMSVVYPFLFTSDATPMEVARALKVRYGLLPPEPLGDPTNLREQTPPGVVYLW